MKTIENYITEKLKISSNTKSERNDVDFDMLLQTLNEYITDKRIDDFSYSLANSVGHNLYHIYKCKQNTGNVYLELRLMRYNADDDFITIFGKPVGKGPRARFRKLECYSTSDLVEVFDNEENVIQFFNYIYKNLEEM
jgi:hypothetical protein